MDISDTLAPKSDQLDAVDLLGQPPRIFTVDRVTRGNSEQPIQVHLKEFPRPWRPGKNQRRVLAFCWTNDASTWPGRQVELFTDPDVMFGGIKVGGIRISRMSHIGGPTTVPIIVKKGQGGGYKVDPLPTATESPASPVDILRAEWQTADPERRKAIEAEVAELTKDGAQ